MMTGKINPADYEGGHDPELTGSEQPTAGKTRGAEFHDSVSTARRDFWGDDPFMGLPGAHGEDDWKF
jgi:hypothetical protein